MTPQVQPANQRATHPGRILESLALLSTPVLFEIEQTKIRFRSRITLEDGKVIVAKPNGLNGSLTAESSLRLRLPDRPGDEVRLKVVVPHADPGTGTPVFICEAPEGPIKNKRSADRYSVLHDDRLQLKLKGQIFQLADVSLNGLRIALSSSQTQHGLPIGHNLGGAKLMFGAEVWVRLEELIPRNRQGRLIGCELKIVKDDVSTQNMIALVDALKHTPIAVTSAAESPGRYHQKA